MIHTIAYAWSALLWLGIILLGSLAGESIWFGQKQKQWLRQGLNLQQQLNEYLKERADDLVRRVMLGVIASVVFTGADSLAGLSEYMAQVTGIASLQSISLTPMAATALFCLFCHKIFKKWFV
jgi:hypothetical protein